MQLEGGESCKGGAQGSARWVRKGEPGLRGTGAAEGRRAEEAGRPGAVPLHPCGSVGGGPGGRASPPLRIQPRGVGAAAAPWAVAGAALRGGRPPRLMPLPAARGAAEAGGGAGGSGGRLRAMCRPGVRGLLGRACLLLLPPCALVLAAVPGSASHPQPCQILRRIGHTVRVGATHLQPRAAAWPGGEAAGGSPEVGSAAGPRGRRPGGGGERRPPHSPSPRDALLLAVANLNGVAGLLPYNLSLEVVMAIEAGLGDLPLFPFSSPSASWSNDPVSFLQSLCHTVVVQGVSAILAFPQSRGEMLELDFISAALRIPVVSIVLGEFPRRSPVRRRGERAGLTSPQPRVPCGEGSGSHGRGNRAAVAVGRDAARALPGEKHSDPWAAGVAFLVVPSLSCILPPCWPLPSALVWRGTSILWAER